jgi:type III secretion protein T
LDQLLYIGLALTRLAAAFALMPVFGRALVPHLVRNSIFVSFALIVLALQPPEALMRPTPPLWIALFLRELFIGVSMGFLLGAVLWAFDAAGSIMDAKISGAASGEVVSPFSGEQTTLHGALLGQLALYIFVMFGGLSLFVSVLLESYVVWPLSASAPNFHMADSSIFEGRFERMMALAIGLAAPALVILTIVDSAMGLINRFAPQLNVFAASLSIKAWLTTFLILVFSAVIVRTILNEMVASAGAGRELMHLLARP